MIYFENHCRGVTGLNNHVVSFTLCAAIANFLGRDFYFDYELPTITLPEVNTDGALKKELEHIIHSRRSLVSDLLDIPSRRIFEIDREVGNKLRVEDPMLTFMTDRAQEQKFGNTMIQNFFSLGRGPFVKEDLEQFEILEFGPNCIINASFYFFLEREEKRRLLDSIRIRYRAEIEELAAKISSSLGDFNAAHIRLGDFKTVYGPDGFVVEQESFRAYLTSVFAGSNLPLLISTDEFQNDTAFEKMLDGFDYKFLDRLILEKFFEDIRSLPFSDFNVLTVLDQLVCASSDRFVGTCRSTFTSVIHRLRQERYGKTDINLLPDARVRRHLDAEFRPVPDGQGFFEWNRYSAFNEHYEYPAWMREWNYELTAV